MFPTATVPKLSELFERLAGVVPVPERAIDCGLSEELLVTVNLAENEAIAAGVNVTWMVQLAEAASVLGLKGQLLVDEKSAAPVPVNPMLLIVSAFVWVFFNVAVCAALAVPSGWLPKDSPLVGVSVLCAKEPAAKKRRPKSSRATLTTLPSLTTSD